MHLTSNSFYLNHLHLKKFKIKNIRFLTLRTLGDFRGIVQTPLFWFYFGPFLYNGVYFVCFSFNCILDQYQWRTVILREVLKRQENFLSLIQDQHCFVLIYLDRYLSNLNYQSIKVVVEHKKNLTLRPGIQAPCENGNFCFAFISLVNFLIGLVWVLGRRIIFKWFQDCEKYNLTVSSSYKINQFLRLIHKTVFYI